MLNYHDHHGMHGDHGDHHGMHNMHGDHVCMVITMVCIDHAYHDHHGMLNSNNTDNHIGPVGPRQAPTGFAIVMRVLPVVSAATTTFLDMNLIDADAPFDLKIEIWIDHPQKNFKKHICST